MKKQLYNAELGVTVYPYLGGELHPNVFLSEEDKKNGSPKQGDVVMRINGKPTLVSNYDKECDHIWDDFSNFCDRFICRYCKEVI